MPTTLRDCPSCGDEREFEQPPCHDGHGADCPEWACIDCGHAIVVEFDVRVEVWAMASPADGAGESSRADGVDRAAARDAVGRAA